MPHEHSNLLIFGGLLTSMIGIFLTAYSPTWGIRGSPKLASFFFLAGFALIVTGTLIILSANH